MGRKSERKGAPSSASRADADAAALDAAENGARSRAATPRASAAVEMVAARNRWPVFLVAVLVTFLIVSQFAASRQFGRARSLRDSSKDIVGALSEFVTSPGRPQSGAARGTGTDETPSAEASAKSGAFLQSDGASEVGARQQGTAITEKQSHNGGQLHSPMRDSVAGRNELAALPMPASPLSLQNPPPTLPPPPLSATSQQVPESAKPSSAAAEYAESRLEKRESPVLAARGGDATALDISGGGTTDTQTSAAVSAAEANTADSAESVNSERGEIQTDVAKAEQSGTDNLDAESESTDAQKSDTMNSKKEQRAPDVSVSTKLAEGSSATNIDSSPAQAQAKSTGNTGGSSAASTTPSSSLDSGAATLSMWEGFSTTASTNKTHAVDDESSSEEQQGDALGENSSASETVASNESRKADSVQTPQKVSADSGATYSGGGAAQRAAFRGVVRGMVDGVNVTRLSYMVFRIMKQTNSTSLLDFPCARNIVWAPEFVSRMDFEMHGFLYTCGALSEDELHDVRQAFQGKAEIETVVHSLADANTALPKTDVLLSWSGMQYWSLSQSWNLIRLGRASAAHLMLASNPRFDNLRLIARHAGVARGKVNLRKQPMLLDKPAKVVDNLTSPQSNSHPMLLMLWHSKTMKRVFGGRF